MANPKMVVYGSIIENMFSKMSALSGARVSDGNTCAAVAFDGVVIAPDSL